ncbi:MAG TPA: DUF4142 domain-containing protein [Polyangiaceae bacterium]
MVPASRIVESPEPGAAQGREAEPTPAPTALTDRQVATASERAHSAAIDEARLAFTKAKDPEVKSFAQMMLADHGRAKEQETALVLELHLSPEDSSVATAIGVESGKAQTNLREMEGSSFDHAYVDAQISALDKYLNALDTRLIPDSKELRLTQALVASRTRSADQLKKARELKKALESATETKGSVPSVPSTSGQ